MIVLYVVIGVGIAILFFAPFFMAGDAGEEKLLAPLTDEQKWPYVIMLEKLLAASRRNEKDLREELAALRKEIQK